MNDVQDRPAGRVAGEVVPTENVPDRMMRAAVVGMFLLLLLGALFFAQDFLVPVILAFLMALVLSPIVRALARRGVPESVTAIALVVLVFIGLGAAAYGLSGPVAKWIADAPSMAVEVQRKIVSLRKPVDTVVDVSEQVEKMAESSDPTVQKVVLAEPGLLTRAATGAPEAVAKIGMTLVLLLFLLASGDLFFEKLVKSLPTLSDKKRGLRIAREVQREVSRYLLTISLINAGLGVAIGTGMWLVGMPNPILWGVIAGLINFVPYIGAVIGITIVAVVGLVSFESTGQALLAPAVYAVLTIMEGQIITPMLVGRRLEMNSVVVFLAVAFWGWLWGIIGAIIAVPMLVVVKVFADHMDGLHGLGQFLGPRDVRPEEDADD